MAKTKTHRLKDLLITKVDFVDAGANQRANIKLVKRAPEKTAEQGDGSGALMGILAAIAKGLGLKGHWQQENAAGTDPEAERVAKDAQTFQEVMGKQKKREICNEIWRLTSALEESLVSIYTDDEADDKATALKQSIDEFSAVAKQAADSWCAGTPLGIFKKDGDNEKPSPRPKDEPDPGDPDPEQDKNGVPVKTTPKKDDKKTPAQKNRVEEDTEMRINKNLLSDAEKAFLDAIEKKAGVAADDNQNQEGQNVQKNAPAEPAPVIPEGLQRVMETIDKRLAASQNEKLSAVAKKYELLGVKAEEIIPVLKMAEEKPDVYGPFVKRMDAALAAVEGSGVFDEIGKRGNVSGEADDPNEAWAQVEKKAEEIRKARPELNVYQARDLVCRQNPELAARLD